MLQSSQHSISTFKQDGEIAKRDRMLNAYGEKEVIITKYRKDVARDLSMQLERANNIIGSCPAKDGFCDLQNITPIDFENFMDVEQGFDECYQELVVRIQRY